MQPEDEEVFDEFVRARQPELLRFGHVLTGNPDAAADLVQDALERTLAAWPRVRNRDDPEGYVRRTMVNRNVSIWRRRRREHLTDEVPDQVHQDKIDLPDPALRAAIAGLPPRQRTVVVLRYAEDLSEQQVAEMLGCSVGTVKSQASKALKKIRNHMPADAIRPNTKRKPTAPPVSTDTADMTDMADMAGAPDRADRADRACPADIVETSDGDRSAGDGEKADEENAEWTR